MYILWYNIIYYLTKWTDIMTMLDEGGSSKPKLTGQQSIERLITYAVAICFIALVLTIGSCTAHSNSYDPKRLKEEAAVKEQEVKIQHERLMFEKERSAAIERLVDKGVNPIAARCAIEGWDKKATDVVCVSAVNAKGKE